MGVGSILLINLQVFICLLALNFVWEAVKGFRGVPNHEGKVTSPAMASILLVVAAIIMLSAIFGIPLFLSLT